MPQPPRRINDAQVDRLLAALQSVEYRQKLARKLAQKDNIKYKSAMRRLERYVTTGVQKRSFARAPLQVRRETVKIARRLPVPSDYRPPTVDRRPLPEQIPLPRAPFLRHDIPPHPTPSPYRPHEGRDAPDNYEYRAILAYFDGDADDAGETLQEFGAPKQTARMLELVAKNVDILGVRGVGRLAEAVIDWFDTLGSEDVEDVDDFSELLLQGAFPEWQQEIMMQDLMDGESTFAEWMDAWRDGDNKIFRTRGEAGEKDLEDSEFWRMWRAAYARAKK